jgi:two-component system CitB family response regulator
VRDAIQLGANHYIVKPFTAHQLTDRLMTYKAAFNRLQDDHEISQQELDQTMALLRGKQLISENESRNGNPTTDLILNCLKSHSEALSASEIASEMGISRATAQRYLSQMADRKLVILELQYGTAGRPINKFKIAPKKAI